VPTQQCRKQYDSATHNASPSSSRTLSQCLFPSLHLWVLYQPPYVCSQAKRREVGRGGRARGGTKGTREVKKRGGMCSSVLVSLSVSISALDVMVRQCRGRTGKQEQEIIHISIWKLVLMYVDYVRNQPTHTQDRC
jgi:hypothetical protein